MAKMTLSSKIWTWTKRIFLVLFFLNIAYIVALRWINPPFTTVMVNAWIHGYGLKRNNIDYSEMGNNIKLAVICSEDQLFPDHNGFDWDAIKKAMQYNNNPKHKKIRGASTISQQVAKNVFLWNGRNWLRKGLEVYHTFMIEWIWGKKRILQAYLNVAEMGKGIFGISAAAEFYFHKKPAQLSQSEAAWIATILPNPKIYNIEKPTPAMMNKHKWILRQMNNLQDDPEINTLLQ